MLVSEPYEYVTVSESLEPYRTVAVDIVERLAVFDPSLSQPTTL